MAQSDVQGYLFDPFERTRGDYWTIFGRDWTEIYSTSSLVIVRQNHDPSRRTRGDCLTIFWRLDGNRLKMIPRVYWTTSRPFWTYKRRLFFSGMGWKDTRRQFCIFRYLDCLLHFVFAEICCSHKGVPQGLPMCYLLTKR